jgi:hypothetical protein
LDDFAVTREGIVKDPDSFLVSRGWELMQMAFPDKVDMLGVLGEACAEPGELVEDGDPLTEDVVCLTVVVHEPGDGIVGGQFKRDLAGEPEHEGGCRGVNVCNVADVEGPHDPGNVDKEGH